MPRKIIKRTQYYTVYLITGVTKFRGCQCYKDCTCHEDFKSKPYKYWEVKRITSSGRKKTTHHTNIISLKKRLKLLNKLTQII